MNIKQAKQKVTRYRLIGGVCAILATISTVVSLSKMIYFRMSDGSKFGETLIQPFRNLVSLFYEHTQPYIGWFWEYSPTPDFRHWNTGDNITFILIYLIIFIGATFVSSGDDLAKRIKKILKEIEDQEIKDSITGRKQRSLEEIEDTINIEHKSIFKQVHSLYIAPIVVGLILVIVGKLLQ